MATLVHPSAIEQDDKLLERLKKYRLAPVGTPLTKNDTLIVSWDYRHKAASLLPSRMLTVIALNPTNESPMITTKGVHTERRVGSILMQSYQKRAQQNQYRLFQTMPNTWGGKTWFSMKKVNDIARSPYAYLLDTRHATCTNYFGEEYERNITSYCRPVDCEPYVREGVTPRYKLTENKTPNFKTLTDAIAGNAVHTKESFYTDDKEKVCFNLRQCLDYMPRDASVMATIANWPYELVPRGYLEWLVSDGDLGDSIMSTALPGPNALRDSILSFLSETSVFKMYNGTLEEEGKLKVIGNTKDNPMTRDIRKRWARMDTEEKDLAYRDFSTCGYWNKDTFIGAGTSSYIPFEAHGPATWLEAHDGKRDSESLPKHLKTGLTEFERQEKWTPTEKENYDWKPVRISSNINKATDHLFNLHQRLDLWEQRHDFLLRRNELEMRELDRDELDWEFKEHELEIVRIKNEYVGILSQHKHSIPASWGIKDRIIKLRTVASYDARKMADLIEDMLEYASLEEQRSEEEQTYWILLTQKVTEWREYKQELDEAKEKHRKETRLIRPALSWNMVEDLDLSKADEAASLRWAIRFAKTQAPTLNKRKYYAPYKPRHLSAR